MENFEAAVCDVMVAVMDKENPKNVPLSHRRKYCVLTSLDSMMKLTDLSTVFTSSLYEGQPSGAQSY